ncbi:ParB/RepB/Spo0J family partition protein [Clostridium butyricum]|uniref:ParB/RepB/Spo0J family partition protein n=1 Tax=Clostridium butyricum TaxID=1492 RepID=UPI0005C1638A|nr:ParB N-terminal domain-containing protein [Clostridium butyricum]KIU07868.1 ParB protein [Clostridium butyricum]MBA8967696.1 ParB family chromosome partitioning protein [Clostridium butyricum]MBC2427558.1 ParB N-terminal domain-containing protein [Clostridium butyricum]QCJ08020.1 chromosome partitioning protein ParB [Clostridium butyricum]QJU44193.1 ParB N-terminal domain-containing protein [Clostridium butyricum]
MAVTGKFTLNDIMKNKSTNDKDINITGYRTIKLSPYDVIPSQSNFYSQENIEELADTFLLVGQQQPTVLGKVDGEFRILSGHRRNKANIFNIERGYKQFEKVEYLYKEMTEAFFELSLIVGNAFTRKLTPYEEAEQIQRLKEALIKARDEDGLEIKGKLRNIIAELLDISSTQVARMEAINNNLVGEAKEQFKDGKLNTTSAYETSKLSAQEQKDIVQKVARGEDVKAKEIAQMVLNKKKSEIEKVSESDTKENENLAIVDLETGEIVEQKTPNYLNENILNIIQKMSLNEMADFICSRCNGGNGCAGFCDLAIQCTEENKHSTCIKWLSTQTII